MRLLPIPIRELMKLLPQVSSVFVGLFLCGCTPFWFLTEKHSALVWSLPEEPGQFESKTFQTKFGQREYEIWLNFKRTIPFDMLDCYIGMPWNAITNCADYPSQINFIWELVGDEKLVASGVAKGSATGMGWMQKEVERWVGGFVATQGVDYQLRINMLQSSALIRDTEPTFLIYSCYNPTNKHIKCRP